MLSLARVTVRSLPPGSPARASHSRVYTLTPTVLLVTGDRPPESAFDVSLGLLLLRRAGAVVVVTLSCSFGPVRCLTGRSSTASFALNVCPCLARFLCPALLLQQQVAELQVRRKSCPFVLTMLPVPPAHRRPSDAAHSAATTSTISRCS